MMERRSKTATRCACHEVARARRRRNDPGCPRLLLPSSRMRWSSLWLAVSLCACAGASGADPTTDDVGPPLDGALLETGDSTLDGVSPADVAVVPDSIGAADVHNDAADATSSETDPTPSGACGGPLFIDAIASWKEVVVDGGGMDAIRSAISTSDVTKATRITVKAGTYNGQCLYVEDHLRDAKSPLWLRAEGVVQIDCTDGNGQAVAFAHSSYIAFDGFTIGPATGYYGDSAVHIAGSPVHPEDSAHYGEFLPSHHVIVRNLTARNLNRGPDGDGNPDSYESGCCDAVKSNQAEYIWVLDSTVSRTARHGFDNVGVHHAYFCHNTLTDMVGAGFAMEAKGGSNDILFQQNMVRRARRRGIVLGGEGSDNVYMWPWDAKYEGTAEIARDNIVLDAAEGGLGFYGCRGCTAIGNSVWITKGYSTAPHDLFRLASSTIEGSTSLWSPPRRAGELLRNGDNRVIDNLFGDAAAALDCAMNANDNGVDGLTMSHNSFWNGGKALPECGSGATSLKSYTDAASFFGGVDPMITLAGTPTLLPDLTPKPGSPLISAGVADPALDAADFAGKKRRSPPSIGALE